MSIKIAVHSIQPDNKQKILSIAVLNNTIWKLDQRVKMKKIMPTKVKIIFSFT